jgi:hypothetical protein
LKSIDLSWNGLGYEGILALCEALRTNTTLQIINLSNNRINWKAAEILGKILQRNKTLQALKLRFLHILIHSKINQSISNKCSPVKKKEIK